MAVITKPTNTSKYAPATLKVDPSTTTTTHSMSDSSGVAIIKDKNALIHFANANKNNAAGRVAAYLVQQEGDKVAWASVSAFFMGDDGGKSRWASSKGINKHSPKAMLAYYANPKVQGIKEQAALNDGVTI